MLYWMCEQSDTTINKKQIEHVILRNFGGLEGVNAIHFFKNRVIIRDQEPTADDCLQVRKSQLSYEMVIRCNQEVHSFLLHVVVHTYVIQIDFC